MANKLVGSDPYERLANAIIMQAVSDYRSKLKIIKKNPNNRDAIYEAMQIEKFFQGQWFQELTTIDGEFLIKKLREEVREKSQMIRR